eukprot:scaffold2255_cov293-Chaetoceros_neogracile.AAC.10
MKDCNLFQLCDDKKWSEVRKYVSSDAAKEEKKSNIMCSDDYGQTCLHATVYWEAPADIIKEILDIGGKELVINKAFNAQTALHYACNNGASYNIIKMLIEVGGKDLVMAKNEYGYTALHDLCGCIKRHAKVAEKIILILKVGDDNVLLSAKNHAGQTPLEIATEEGASKRIKKLLTLQTTTSVSDMQMEGRHAQELLESSNRRAADLEATVETQRLEIADLSSEKDDIEKSLKDEVDKLTRKLSKQQAELQVLKDSSSDIEVGMKRKHTNEEHEEGEGTVVVQSQTQSSKRSKVENAANIPSGSLNSNQAEDNDGDAVIIAGQLVQNNMLMSWYMAIRRRFRSAKA